MFIVWESSRDDIWEKWEWCLSQTMWWSWIALCIELCIVATRDSGWGDIDKIGKRFIEDYCKLDEKSER